MQFLRAHILPIFIITLLSILISGCASPYHCQELQLGQIYFQEGDFKRSFHQLLPLAVEGYPDAQYAIGYMYYNGYGACQDEESGIFWMNKAAAKGYLPASRALYMITHCPTVCDLVNRPSCCGNEERPSPCDTCDAYEQRRVVYYSPHKRAIRRMDTTPAYDTQAVNCDETCNTQANDCPTPPPVIIDRPRPIETTPVQTCPVEDEVLKCVPREKTKCIPEPKCNPAPCPCPAKPGPVVSTNTATPTPAYSPAPNNPIAQNKPQPKILETKNENDLTNISTNKTSPQKPNFVIQVAGAFNPQVINTIQNNANLKKQTKIYRTTHDGKDWYVLTYGKFPTLAEAKIAHNHLSTDLQQMHPWVRNTNDLTLIG